MKKVFFTALALVAFSSASMANTIADEEIVKENKKEVKEEVTQKRQTDCLAVFMNTFIALAQSGADFNTAYGAAGAVEAFCEFSNRAV